MKIKLSNKSLFKPLLIGHIVIFLFIGLAVGIYCLTGGTIDHAPEIKLPGITFTPPLPSELTGLKGFLYAVSLGPLSGSFAAITAWFFTKIGLWLLDLIPGIEVEN